MQVAIKKALQDKRFKNRELQIMKMVDHPNIVRLKHCFYSTTEKDETYLHLVLEFVPDTVYRISEHYAKNNQRMPNIFVKLYAYQMCRALQNIHRAGICHRDIKPQNLLVNTETHQLKLCDFGSAKVSGRRSMLSHPCICMHTHAHTHTHTHTHTHAHTHMRTHTHMSTHTHTHI